MNPEMMAMLHNAAEMFLFLALELTLLFLVISYAVGVLQRFLTPEKIQSILSSRKGKGYIIAALLGAITPFCSCSTIPFLKGLLRAKAGFGPMMVFLFASPLLNPIIIGLFVITFGWQVALFYFSIALIVSVIAGFLLEILGFQRYVKPEAYSVESTTSACCTPNNKPIVPQEKNPMRIPSVLQASGGAPLNVTNLRLNTIHSPTASPQNATSCCATAYSPDIEATPTLPATQPNIWWALWLTTWQDFKQVLPYLLVGITLGAFIYGFIPTEFIVRYAGADKWYAIPIAAIIGIPLYLRAEAIIPLSAALVQKGMAMGSVMALIIGSAGASLTEVILLKAIFKTPMIVAFLCVILGMAMSAGFLYLWIL